MCLTLSIVVLLAAPGPPAIGGALPAPAAVEQEPECASCDIAEEKGTLESELAFLERAEAAFVFSHRSTTEVKARIATMKERIERFDEEGDSGAEPPSLDARIGELKSKLRFLERAEAAFLHSHRSTADVKRRIEAARECLETLRDCQERATGRVGWAPVRGAPRAS